MRRSIKRSFTKTSKQCVSNIRRRTCATLGESQQKPKSVQTLSLFLAIQKINALCLYHFARYMRMYHAINEPYFNDFRFCKIHTKSASSENLCCSSILRFSMFSFSVAESSLTYLYLLIETFKTAYFS